MLTEIINNKPTDLDYAYVFYILSLFEEEEQKTRKKVKDILKESQKENFNLSISHTVDNLNNLGITYEPISLDYNKIKTKNMDGLVDKQFNKLTKDIKDQILNALNTGDMNGLTNILETKLKTEKKTQSTLNRLMRISRTENTKARSEANIKIQQELALQGIEVKRVWVHTLYNSNNVISDNYEPRQDHLMLNGVVEDRSGYFHTSNGDTRGPGMFGIPEEDINCRCDTEFKL